jgi:hypothetical protein
MFCFIYVYFDSDSDIERNKVVFVATLLLLHMKRVLSIIFEIIFLSFLFRPKRGCEGVMKFYSFKSQKNKKIWEKNKLWDPPNTLGGGGIAVDPERRVKRAQTRVR